MTKTYTFGPRISVEVKDVGAGLAPWGGTETRTEYDVRVKTLGASYKTKAWGSIRDFDQGRLDHESIGATVVGELASAAADPEGFLDMVSEGATGRDAANKVAAGKKVIKAAQKIGWPALEAATDEIRERGLD